MKKLFVGNWKMYLTVAQEAELAKVIANMQSRYDIVIAPSYLNLGIIKGINIAAQDVSEYDNGAHTSEISGVNLAEIGCKYTLVGHSEIRARGTQTPEILGGKVRKATSAGLSVIFCIGETLEEYKQGKAEQVLKVQLEVLKGASASNVIIAYEPIWSIGTGLIPTIKEIESRCSFIRSCIGKDFKVLYGGSVNADNIESILTPDSVSGVLVGKASTQIEQLESMLK